MFRMSAFLLLLLSLGCGGPSVDETIVINKDNDKEVLGALTTETFRVDNSTGTEPMTSDQTALKQYTHRVEVIPAAGTAVDTDRVRTEVFLAYNISTESRELPKDAACALTRVNVPPGNVYLYDIEWQEKWREGTFDIGQPDGTPEGTYRFRETLNCRIVGARVEP
ncbi:hypothetical protein EYB53_001960 [Candidatus Chloroploca sp. M-50]|uniref:Lipoprotein n=2 Tax=Candidatus Chloroploca mongolica TaxID=2528176 RepID=A0ABS4D4X7_9CHLR|nr:hypothetical protein [Candidatus Chloroploca mongolica]